MKESRLGETLEELLENDPLGRAYNELHRRMNLTNADQEVENVKAAMASGAKIAWEYLLFLSPITVVDATNFPRDEKEPVIVFFSADWCFPCQITKPVFARLSHFFDKAGLYYCADVEVREREGIEWIPQLVAYFPDGKISSHCGGTTEELWNNLNMLITLGRDATGDNELVCGEGGVCALQPKQKPDKNERKKP